MIRRCCLGCGHRYVGPVQCPHCPDVGEPLPALGRPSKPPADRRTHRIEVLLTPDQVHQLDLDRGPTPRSTYLAHKAGLL